jgi:hypothetical protein
MFLDRGQDSFLGEVIGLVEWRSLHIDIVPGGVRGTTYVLIEFQAIIHDRGGDSHFHSIKKGRSYGEALRKIREHLRMEIGQ